MDSKFRDINGVEEYASKHRWGLYQDFPAKVGDVKRKVVYITEAGIILRFLVDGHGEVIKITALDETVWGE